MEVSITHLEDFSRDAVNFKDLVFSWLLVLPHPSNMVRGGENLPQIRISKIELQTHISSRVLTK